MAGILAFDRSNVSWRPIVWLLLGIGILYYFVIRPYLKRGSIKESNASQQDLVLVFDDDLLKLEISGVANFTRKWEELVDFIDTRKGIIFCFSDGVVNWLPERVFSDSTERNNFIEFLRAHQSQAHFAPE